MKNTSKGLETLMSFKCKFVIVVYKGYILMISIALVMKYVKLKFKENRNYVCFLPAGW